MINNTVHYYSCNSAHFIACRGIYITILNPNIISLHMKNWDLISFTLPYSTQAIVSLWLHIPNLLCKELLYLILFMFWTITRTFNSANPLHTNQFLSLFVVENWEGVTCFLPFLLLPSLFNFTPSLSTFNAFLFYSPLAVFLGHPLFLTPWGFQTNANCSIAPFSFLSVWPTHCYFLSLICCVPGFWLVVSQKSSIIHFRPSYV